MDGKRFACTLAVLGAVAAGGCSPNDHNQLVMPDLTGKYWAGAQPQLDALGWDGVMNYAGDVPSYPANHGRIIFQDPPAGSTVGKDAEITLRFGQ